VGGAAVSCSSDAEAERRRDSAVVRCDSKFADGVGGAAAAGDGRQISGGRDSVPSGDGGAWEVQADVSAMRNGDPANQIRFKRDELLSDVPDRRETVSRPGAVTAASGRLAENVGGTGVPQGDEEEASRGDWCRC